MTLSVYRLTWRLPLAGLVAFSHLQFSQIRGRQPHLIVRNILYVIRSNGSSCRNTTSPQKYWKYGFSTHCSHSASSERLCICLRMNSPATSRVGNGGCPGPMTTSWRLVRRNSVREFVEKAFAQIG